MEEYYCKPRQNDQGKWAIDVVTYDGELVRVITKDTENQIRTAYTKGKKVEELNLDSREKNKTTFLDNIYKSGMENTPAPINMFPVENPDYTQAVQDHKTDFDKNDKVCTKAAKNLLESVGRMYLDAKFIKDNDYITFKQQIEAENLSFLLLQLAIAKKALFKLSERISLDDAKDRTFEVLSTAQRVWLDIGKFQHEYMISLEDSMKKLKTDESEIELQKSISQAETGQTSGTLIGTSNRKKLMIEITQIVEESKMVIMTPQSKNVKLQDVNGGAAVDTQFEEIDGSESEEGRVEKDPSLGLETM